MGKQPGATIDPIPTHVLLIEDNPGDADLVRLRLVEAQSDINVCCVDRLSSALDSISVATPAVVLLDLNLPDSQGAETFRSLLNRAPGVPVVVLSGHDDEELALKAVHQGVQDYLVKGDFDGKQLARAMRYAIERQALLTTLDMSRKRQLQFKDDFLSHVSHELRTPLTCIHQFVTILLDGLAGPVNEEQREHLGTVLRSANQLRSMISDLLEATRAETRKIRVEPRCISIRHVLQQAVHMLQASAKSKQVGLECAIDSRIPLVYADPERALQVFINLIDNAIKFTPPDGSVIVKACLADVDPEFVYLSVTDTGRGIRPESKALIFERMFQDPDGIDDSRKGLGLGLYIAKELVDLQGGRIWATSEPGHGSILSFTLPLFSPAKLLPFLIEDGILRKDISLIQLDYTPADGILEPAWQDACQLCLSVLQKSVYYTDRDLVLPGIKAAGPGETFFIMASADLQCAKVMVKRVRAKLEHSPDLTACGKFHISVTPVKMPPLNPTNPTEAAPSLAAHIYHQISATADPSPT
jgi:sigma-B regulation protein RsbU (phosphoserine phosphatase)